MGYRFRRLNRLLGMNGLRLDALSERGQNSSVRRTTVKSNPLTRISLKCTSVIVAVKKFQMLAASASTKNMTTTRRLSDHLRRVCALLRGGCRDSLLRIVRGGHLGSLRTGHQSPVFIFGAVARSR